MQDYSTPDKTSPDGTIKVEFGVSTGLMSHEIYSPRVVALPSGEVLADLWGTQWDASAQFQEAGRVTLELRHYGDDKPGFGVTIDARARSFWFTDNPAGRHALDEFAKLIERKPQAQKPYAASRQTAKSPRRILQLFCYAALALAAFFVIVWLFDRFKLFR